MKPMRLWLLTLAALAVLVSQAAAGQSPTVYVTKSGKKYHQAGCSYLRKSSIPISLKDAVNRGYAPCSRCKPPTLADVEPEPDSAASQPSNPADTSKVQPAPQEPETIYIGNAKTGKYHLPYCRWAQKISPSNFVKFDSKAEAERKGFKPCKVCKP